MPGALLILELDRVVAQLSGCSPGDQKSPHALPLMGRMEAGAEGNSRKDAPCCQLFLPFDCCRSGLLLFSQRQLKREIRTDLPRWRLQDLGLGWVSRVHGRDSKESPSLLQ